MNDIKLEKGMYSLNKSFSQTLAELDPDENYKGTELEGLDAFARQLKRFDIRLSGANSDRVEKFFQTSDSAVLFPEYVSRAVERGMQEVNLIPQLTAATTLIDSLDYRSVTCDPDEKDKKLAAVAEGAYIPQTKITTKSHLVSLRKRGRMLVSSYEAIKTQRLDVFTVMLSQIGRHIAKSQLRDAVDVLLRGDGNSNAAQSVGSTTNLSYGDLLKIWMGLRPYDMTALLVNPANAMKIMQLPEFRDACAGLDFHGTGTVITPFGAKMIIDESVPAENIIGVDSGFALELVSFGGVNVEYDKLIDRQLERAAVTATYGFSKLTPDAVKELDVS